MLFQSYSDAEKARKLLAEKMTFNVKKPSIKYGKRRQFVGLPYSATSTEIAQSIVKHNSVLDLVLCPDEDNCVFMRSDVSARMKILDVIDCSSGVFKFRALLTNEFASKIERFKLRALNCILHWYE